MGVLISCTSGVQGYLPEVCPVGVSLYPMASSVM